MIDNDGIETDDEAAAEGLAMLRRQLHEAREELKAAQHVGQLAARDRDSALAERNRWQDKACKLECELATLRAALRRFKASTQQGARAEYLAAQAALVALAKEGA